MRGSIIAFALVISLFVLSEGYPTEVSESVAASNISHFSNLSELASQFSAEIKQELGNKRLFLEGASVRELGTSKTHNFSLCLQNELESSLSRDGFILVYEMADADYLIGAAYQRLETSVRVFFKYHRADLSGKKGRTYEIEISRLPKDSFKESINTKAYELASNILEGQGDLKIFMNPLFEGTRSYTTPFSTSFISRIKNAMVSLRKGIQIVDKEPVGGSIAVLSGNYFDRGNEISVHLFLKDGEGRVLSSSIVDIDKSLIKSKLQNETARKLTDFLDEPPNQGDFRAKVFTPKGKDYPVYCEGEEIRFHIQVASPLYIYLYALNSRGEVARLFPYEEGMQQHQLMPGRLYTIPHDADNFGIEVKPPFGAEAVKLFGTSAELPLPNLDPNVKSKSYNGIWRVQGDERLAAQEMLSQTKTINPKDIIDYYRGIANRLHVTVYEDSLLLETRKR